MGTNGPLAIVLDPAGYYYAEEEGVAFQWDANDLWAQGNLKPQDGFFSAEGSPWLMPQAQQFRDDWWSSSFRRAHLLDMLQWDYAPNVQFRAEYVNHKEVGQAVNSGDEAIGIYRTALSGAPPISVNLFVDDVGKKSIATALFEGTGTELLDPATFGVVAATKQTIEDRKTPFLRVGSFPKPDEPFLFGFARYAALLTRRGIYLLRSSNDLQDWQFIGAAYAGTKWLRHRVQREFTQHGPMGKFGYRPPTVVSHDMVFQDFGFIPVGTDHLFLAGLGGEGHMFQVQKTPGPRPPNLNSQAHIGQGKWWFACAAGRQEIVQVEKVVYQIAEHVTEEQIERGNPPDDPPDAPWVDEIGPLMFNLGKGYQPTPAPELFIDGLVHQVSPGVGPVEENVVEALTDGGRTYGKKVSNPGTGEAITVELYTPHLEKFNNSESATEPASAGYLRIRLEPSGDLESAPQLCMARVRFPEYVLPRVRSTVDETFILEPSEGTEEGIYAASTHWQSLKAGCAYHDLLGKVVTFDIVETVYQPGFAGPGIDKATALTPFMRRQKFPVELREDTDGNAVYETVRVAAWVDKIEIVQVKWQDMDGDGLSDTVTRVYRFHCHGVAKRLDQPWLYLPHIEDMEGDDPNIANGSRLTHLGAIQKCLTQGGFLIESSPGVPNPAVFKADDDSTEPDDLRYLPGDDLHSEAVAGMRKRKNAYKPDPGQKRAHYMETVAHAWAGRALFEKLDGRICYLYDLIQRIYQFGSNPDFLPPPRAVFYRSHREALANIGVEESWSRVGGLTMLDEPPPLVTPLPVQGNAVRVASKAATGDLQAITILKDLKSIHGDPVIGAAYENFVGEPKIVDYNIQGLAVSDPAAMRVAHEVLLELGLRGEILQWAAPFVPWQMTNSTSLDVGDPVGVAGYGQYVIVHAELAIESRDQWVTIFTGWKYPTPLPPYP